MKCSFSDNRPFSEGCRSLPKKVSTGSEDLELYIIDLPVRLKGFDTFINSWLLLDHNKDISVLVDTGPASTIPVLEESLSGMGITGIDHLLLTHIHLDHGGGAGHFIQDHPETDLLVSQRGVRHLVDPSRLWEGSVSTLGETAHVYGRPLPVPESALADPEKLDLPLEILHTPGHASHHLSFRYNGAILFAGEAAGVHLPMENDSHVYLRPATPPPFHLETALSSLDVLMKDPSSIMCYGHYGYTHEPAKMLDLCRTQLLFWEKEIADLLGPHSSLLEKEKWSEAVPVCLQMLMEKDPLLASYGSLVADVREREFFFLQNSIRGFLGYLAEKNQS
jgi:glyoxylase-like metal-dependent hydrolase (beta-lactamase superfamily II)